MPVDRRCDALHQSRVDMVRLDHAREFLKLWLCKGFGKRQTVISVFVLASDIRRPLAYRLTTKTFQGSRGISHPSVCIMYHTRQKRRFVLQVSDAQNFQASDATSSDRVGVAGTISIGLPLELRVVATR